VGIRSETVELPASTDQAKLLEVIDSCNADPDVDALLVQLPLPDQIDEAAIISAVAPQKDVDGFHPHNFGLLAAGKPDVAPCTPVGCMELLRRYNIPIAGKRAVVMGRSLIVGRPMAYLLTAADATVTLCHSKTQNPQSVASEADILVVAIGKPKAIDASYIKGGAAVIDVGISRIEDQLVGDVDFESVSEVAGWITPVPGGVGPMTIASLLRNTLMLAERRAQ
jgi:methylenetetrahydrofolate dehydrogenase (NADP+)/methenyltetrahydrofolate cyclohydrolase